MAGLAALLALMALLMIGLQTVPLLLCVIFPVIPFWLLLKDTFKRQQPLFRDEEIQREPPVIIHFNRDHKLEDVRKQHSALLALMAEHKDHPIIQATHNDIELEARTLMDEATQLAQTRTKLRGILGATKSTEREIENLRLEILAEDNPKVRSVLEATLERRRAELGNQQQLQDSIRYFEALMDQAEATMSELQSRIGVAIAETEDYTNPRARLAVDEASKELRSVSNAMRETLEEIDTKA